MEPDHKQLMEQMAKFFARMDKDTLTKDDFVKAWKIVVEFLQGFKGEHTGSMASIEKTYKEALGAFTNETKTELNRVKLRLMKEVEDMLVPHGVNFDTLMARVKAIEEAPELTMEQVLAEVIPLFPKEREYAPEELRDLLELLQDDERLHIRSIAGVEELFENFREEILRGQNVQVRTGGSLRGFVGGILPRGAGYKTMNALDVEEALRKNLDVIEEALAKQTDAEFMAVLRKRGPFKIAAPEAKTQ